FHIWYFCRKSFRGERTAHDSRLYESRRCGLCTDEHIEKLVDPAIKYRWGGADFWTDYVCTIWTGCFFMDCFRSHFCWCSACILDSNDLDTETWLTHSRVRGKIFRKSDEACRLCIFNSFTFVSWNGIRYGTC